MNVPFLILVFKKLTIYKSLRKSLNHFNEKNSFSKTKINLRRTENQSQPNNFSISAERFFILRKNFLRIQILVKQIFMCFLKNIQPLRHEKMDGHIRIQMQKRRILLFLRHAALANTVASEKHKPDTNERCFYCLAS